MGVSAINQRALLVLVPVLLLVAGAVWLLKQPSWPAALFSTVVVLLFFLRAVVSYWHRNEADGFDPEYVRRSAVTSQVMLTVGLVYVGLGFAQSFLGRPHKRRLVRRFAAPRVNPED